MAGKNQVILTFAGDSSNLERAFARVGTSAGQMDRKVSSAGGNLTRQSQSWGSRLASFGKVAAVGFAAAGVAAVHFGMGLVQAAEDSQKVTRQTDAVIKSMGLQAVVTGDQIAGMSEKLSLATGVDDELIQSGQNVLLTFGQLARSAGETGGNFDRATTAALDMSVALGTDMNSAAMMVGKALNDPIRGLTTLRRSGVQFTAQQEEQIKAMVEAGDVAGAQAIMLGELEAQFGGSAEAQATASQKLSTAWGNLQERLGEKLLPVMESVSSWIVDTGIPALESLSDWVQREGVPRLRDFGNWLGENILPALQAVGTFIVGTVLPALLSLGQWFTEHQRVLAAVAIGITAVLVPAFVAWAVAAGAAAIATIAAAAPLLLIGLAVAALALLIITHWDTIRNATVTAFNAVKNAIASAFNWVRTNWPLLLAILTGPIGLAVLAIARNWDSIKAGATAVKDWIVARWNDVVNFVKGLPGAISAAASGMWDGIKSAFKSAINGIIGLWNGLSFPSVTIGGQDPLGSFGPSLPEVTIGGWDLPNIPLLHTGGEFRAPAGQREGLAMLLDGERVSRPGQAAGPTVHLHVQGSILSERDVVRLIRDEFVRGGFAGVGRP